MKNTILTLCVALLLCASGLMADTAQSYPFLVLLQPGNETPPITDTSSANVVVWVHVVRDSTGAITSGSVDFNLNCKFSGTSQKVVGLHIHNAPAGTPGNIVIPTDVSGSNSIAIDSTNKVAVAKQVQFPKNPSVTIATISDLLVNPQNFYVNVHTDDHPGGLMRGQLMPAEQKVLIGLMKPTNEVPPVASNGTAIGTVIALRARDTSGAVVLGDVFFNVDYTGFDATSFTGLHIHNGNSTVAGPVIINTGINGSTNSVPVSSTGNGTLSYEVPLTPSDAAYTREIDTLNGVFDHPQDFYINVHTNLFGGGAARDQLRNTDSNTFQVTLDPANETPPIVGSTAGATTAVTAYTIRNSDASVAAGVVTFDVNYRGFTGITAFTGLHLHTGAAGVQGPVTIPAGVSGGALAVPVDPSGNGNIYRNVNATNAAAIGALNVMVQNSNGLYENLHTNINAGGAARSQLTPPIGNPVINGVAATSSTILRAAPGSIATVYGSNFTGFTSGLDGFNGLTALPTTLNGVTVTIGGTKAAFYYTNPFQLNIQVPFEASAGAQALIVTNANGSTTSSINVDAVAPSIFIVDQPNNVGAIIRNSDFSLITSTNPAHAGDVLLIYSTGLGQTTPAVQTGVLVVPPTGAFNLTGVVSATIGGQNASIIASIASPSFAGLYQTAIIVPPGVTGKVPVVLKAGAAASNSVNLSVQ
ncbi:MAG TPA: CHRD domain-containing protein [Bryobacteraceae bacterium]|nr:CHRD domain-containing protein [Bryobacteraceae bacterium]